MEDPNITMEEYIRLEEEKVRRNGKEYNWKMLRKIWYDEDVYDIRSIETEFTAIVFDDAFTSEVTLSCEPMTLETASGLFLTVSPGLLRKIWTMDMTIDQQVALDEALVPHASRLRIGKSKFRLRSYITSKELTLQLATATVHHHSIRFKMDNNKHIVNLEYFRDMLHICPRHPAVINKCLSGKVQAMIVFDFVYQVEHKDAKKSNEMYYPRKTKSSSDTTITPPTAAGTRLSTSAKGKQHAKSSKAKGLIVLSEVAMIEAQQMKLAMKRSLQQTHISQASGSGIDEGTDDDDDDDDEVDARSDDQEEDDDQDDDDQDTDNDSDNFVHPKLSIHEEEAKDEECFDPIVQTPENSDDEEGRDVQMTDVHTTQEFEDTHVTLTLVNLDGKKQSSSVSSQFVTSMLNPSPDVGIDSLFETTPRVDVQASTIVASLTLTTPTLPPPTIPTISQIIKEQVKEQLKVQVSKILSKIEKTVNEQLEAVVLTRSSNSSKTSYVVAADLSEIELKKILIEKIRCDDADKDEKPSVRSDRGSKGRREGNKPKSTSAPKEKVSKTTGKSTQGSKSHQKTASESAPAEEPIQTNQDLEEPSHQEFEIGVADDQPITEASQHPECDLAKQADSLSLFNELMDTHVDLFSNESTQSSTLTPELLAGLTYELVKGSCKSLVELEFFLEEVYEATTDQDDDKLYKFKEGDFKRLRIQDIEDMLLLLVQGKLTNLTVKERFAFNVAIRMFMRSIVIQRRVEDLQLGYSNEVFALGYLEKSNKERAAAMIQAIAKQLKTRRIMQSLEKSILMDSHVIPTKHERMTKPFLPHRFIANYFNAGYLKIEVKESSFLLPSLHICWNSIPAARVFSSCCQVFIAAVSTSLLLLASVTAIKQIVIAMKMQNFISSSKLLCWNIILKGNSAKSLTTDNDGNLKIRPPIIAEEHQQLQREEKARTIFLSALPDEHMGDFYHMIDARDIWNAIKARFGGNAESKKM
nr:xylulose kinase-1 [Tanacetum cinerariifolium]